MSVLEVQMSSDLRAAPEAVRRQEHVLSDVLSALVDRLRRRPPQVVVTCARGSSAHAATFGKYLIERHFGIAVAAAAPSITTIYRQRLRLADQLFLAVSQSGKSGDLIELAAAARESGAVTACITNDAESELAQASEFVLPMAAGPELSIPATKTFITSLTALSGASSLVTIGRGPTLAIAREAALKLKETSDLHAEAFSSAEFLHGPVALVTPRYPVLMFAPTDAAAQGMARLADDLRAKGAQLFTTASEDATPDRLAALTPDHPEIDPICLVQSFYAMVVHVAAARGTNADQPRHLRKVTRTR